MNAHRIPDPASTHPLAEWLATQESGLRPEVIGGLARDARIVGLGMSTRAAREVFDVVTDATWRLLDSGFTTIAVLDDQCVVDRYDRYVIGQDIDIDQALAQAWGPWRIAELRRMLDRLRARNEAHPEAPVRVIGIAGTRVLVTDYDRIVELLTGLDARAAAEVQALLDLIRPAHDSGEHVLRARGNHPGVPFVDLARSARAIASRLRPSAERDTAVDLLDAVVGFHANAIGVGYDMAREERAAARRLLDHHRRTGARIVLWEGSAHVAAHPGPMLGAHLRDTLGDGYVAVHITFGHGRIVTGDIPAPQTDSIDAQLAAAHDPRTLDLRTPAPASIAVELERSWPTRLISGLYDPAEDAEHYLELPSLRDSFDALVYVPAITPTESLG
ncbi:erythromycin esterase family protein [Actinoalloteichus hymeniacidonis]|uniref:Erythromycin esterase-like enzyme n=1 Tax=Actinoalloteichus hymeniacidonis TaxID=340345 RepID=A0AAC9MY22_9PSEU|nr:erythromycin esterase family protein [Actinoalloteichus hymeniacidonis]AOS63958.1 erythromycin esterase-like enzyme [Actinoalloteichus hymeniacidonis]MBB5907985.1 erythromycin esterase [Actinoalloteichus hymeniacidonis]